MVVHEGDEFAMDSKDDDLWTQIVLQGDQFAMVAFTHEHMLSGPVFTPTSMRSRVLSI